MFDETGKRLIGVITASAAKSEQRQILEGITAQAQRLGAATAIFSNIYNSSEYYANIEIENRIYDLILSRKLDGLILTDESFLNPDVHNDIFSLLKRRADIPIIITGAEYDNYQCINNDVGADISDITEHLVTVHGFTDIDLLTGWRGMPTSQERVDGFRRVLQAHGIPFREENIIYGDFWMNSGERTAVEYSSGVRRMPQAVICANDYMAYGLCDSLLMHGISVPEDVTVVGYEYVGERYYHSPILTTYQRSRYALGQRAVNLLYEKMTGIAQEPISLRGKMVFGNSCTCGADRGLLDRELRAVRREQFYSNLNLVGNFEQQLALCRSISDYISVLQQFTYLIRDISGVHLCLHENWCSTDISGGYREDTETMVCHRIVSRNQTPEVPAFYQKYNLYPDELLAAGSGDILYFCPIFFSGRELGYFILQYDHPDCYDIIFRDWIKSAANALEFLRMRNDIGTLMECRSLSEMHDSITGLYNENGLRNALKYPLRQADEEDNVLLLLMRTELFFDSSSLEQQELSVRMSMEQTEQLRKIAAIKDMFCARVSDKLYAIAAVGNYTQADAELLADKLHTLISHAPLYSAHCSADSLIVCTICRSALDFDLKTVPNVLYDQINEQTAERVARRQHKDSQEYTALRDMMYYHPDENWDVTQSCRDFHLSTGHFRAVYKELFGISFHQDMIRCRIELAKYLLLTTSLSLPVIAEKCGYEDDKYFLRQFRQITGMTPNAYKK